MAFLAASALLVLLPALPAAGAQDSKGQDFWLTFGGNCDFCGSTTLTLFITGDTATTGTVTIPGLAFAAPFTVTPGSVTPVIVPTSAELQASDTVENKGIHVTALAEVTVYGLSRQQATTDAYLGLPTDVIGTEYINLGYKNVNIVNATQLAIVASQNGTAVTITPTVTTDGHAAGTPYTVNLNQGQTYLLRNTDAEPADLSGTIITSDKPIAVFGGHQCANIPPGAFACDHVEEQLLPTSTWGKNFVSMPLATRTGGDTFRILAAENGTSVSLNGAVVATLNRGQFHEQIVIGPAQITADKPVLVAQYSNSSTFDGVTSDPFEMLIPPFEQFLAGYTISTPASGFAQNFVNVVAPNAAVGAVTLDGSPIPAGSYTPIGSSGFSGVQVPVALGSHTLAGPLPFGVHSYGFDSFDSYGYPGGLSVAEVARVTSLVFAPKTATNTVGTQHCVTGTVKDQNGAPLEGIRVDFTVTGPNARAGFAFTNASGVAQFCYTGTAVGTDSITATVGTLSDGGSKTWVAAQTDTTKPSCVLSGQGTDGAGKKFIEVTARDTGSGLGSILVTKSTNANTVVPPFTVGTTNAVVVRATKINQSVSSVIELRVTDVAGNVTVCDPVVTVVLRASGESTQTHSGIPQAESKILVTNDVPGVMHMDFIVNGTKFRLRGMADGGTYALNVASAMKPGNANTIRIDSKGKPGGTALVVISD